MRMPAALLFCTQPSNNSIYATVALLPNCTTTARLKAWLHHPLTPYKGYKGGWPTARVSG
eukprot:1146079-Pelagomonas_calceolata.AAC.8